MRERRRISTPATRHRLANVGGQAHTYDALGDATQMTGQAYSYNNAGRLSQAKQGATILGTYRYNHRGERVLRQAGGKTTTTLYDESGQWLGDYSASGVPLQQVVWLESYPIAVFSESSAGVPALGYVQPDHLGTPRVIIDATRNVPIWEWALTGEAFGADAANEDPDGDGIAFGFALRFPGQQATVETGLNYNYQRDYDAGAGRYVQSDPIGLMGGASTFTYVAGNPLLELDPLGRQARAVRNYTSPGYTAHEDISYAADGYFPESDRQLGGWTSPPSEISLGAILGSSTLQSSSIIIRGLIGQLATASDDCPVPGTTPDRVTKGNTRIVTKEGGFDAANSDFDSRWPSGVSDKGGGVRVGALEDGRTIIVRPSSSDGSPTIEIQDGKRTKWKIRYVR